MPVSKWQSCRVFRLFTALQVRANTDAEHGTGVTYCGACTATNQAHGSASHQVQGPWIAPAGAGSTTPWTCSAVRWVCRPLAATLNGFASVLHPVHWCVLLLCMLCCVCIDHCGFRRLEQRHLTCAGLVLCSFVAPGSACRSRTLCHQRKL